VLQVRNLTKRYGETVAVDDLSFDVHPGVVTGFLGPNGAGKSTTMRTILGLDHPTSGTATINGRPYRDLRAPLHEVGGLLSAQALQPGRSARAHLRWIARAGGIGPHRVDEVLATVGLSDAAARRVGGFSLGMFQRLGIATALLGDPATLLLDEPGNGLDPEGIRWVRTLMKDLAAEGRTVFVSSHQMREMQDTADRVVVIGQGRFIADMTISDLTQRASGNRVRVVSPRAEALAPLLVTSGASITAQDGDHLEVTGIDAARAGEVAAVHGIPLHELTPQRPTLEAAFLELTRDSVAYRAGAHDGADVAGVARELTTDRS
jgi:ABC-2 type transport system ATP-binding protein